MITLKSEYPAQDRIVIDLTGPQGNAFFMIGQARSCAKQLGYSKEDTEQLLDDMQSSDYDHLIETFDKHFGDYITLLK